jgi:hypothetical protein
LYSVSQLLLLLWLLLLQAQLQSLQASLADAERRVYESELIRRKLHNTIQVGRLAAASRACSLLHVLGSIQPHQRLASLWSAAGLRAV